MIEPKIEKQLEIVNKIETLAKMTNESNIKTMTNAIVVLANDLKTLLEHV